MPKKERTAGEAAPKKHKPTGMGALAQLQPTPKPKLTRGEKRRKKK